MANWYYWRDETLFIQIYLQPRASKNKIIGIYDDCLKISITTPPVEGKANSHLLKFIADCFRVPPYHVALEKGELSRKKWLKIVDPKDISLLNKVSK